MSHDIVDAYREEVPGWDWSALSVDAVLIEKRSPTEIAKVLASPAAGLTG